MGDGGDWVGHNDVKDDVLLGVDYFKAFLDRSGNVEVDEGASVYKAHALVFDRGEEEGYRSTGSC